VPAPRLSEKILRETLDAVDQHDGNISAASRALGVGRSTFEGRYKTALQRFEIERALPEGSAEDGEVTLPIFPDEDIEATEILDHLSRRWERKQASDDAKKWFEIVINSDAPYGLVVVGDPHLGVHSNIRLLRRDVEIMATTPGVGAVNIGDTANNWSTRLIHLYAEEDISRATERKLARWFMLDKESGGAGVPWVVWLHGNHDTMHSEFATYLRTINVAQIPMLDWRAKFKLVFPSAKISIDASHNHKGTSIYSPLHGQRRADLWSSGGSAESGGGGGSADIFVAGHHHTWAIQQMERGDGSCVTYARARGYKWHDEFALRHQFNEEIYGASVIFVIDPTAAPNARVKPFVDLAEGAEFLTWKRSRAK